MPSQNLIPARAIPPGATLRSELESRGITQAAFAKVIGKPKQFISELVNGRRELTVDTARRLEAALDIAAPFWLNREVAYRLRLAELNDVDSKDTLSAIRSRASEIALV